MCENEKLSKKEEYYQDWLSDNKRWLADHYISDHEDDFSDYCKKKFEDDVNA